MEILNRLFGKKETKTITVSEDYNQVASFIDNCVSMEDCKLASTIIDDLGEPYPHIKLQYGQLRNNLCDKTFNIFLDKTRKE